MSLLAQLASALGHRDETPNIELARTLVEQNDQNGLAEIAAHLNDRDSAVASDCIKVLYEAAALNPNLAAPFTMQIVKLLAHKDNRLVWGAMTALSEVAPLRASEIYGQIGLVMQALRSGSVITIDRGVKVLAHLCAASPEYSEVCFPEILRILAETPPKGLAYRGEAALPALTSPPQRAAFLDLLERRATELTPSQFSRINLIMKQARGW